MAKFIKVVVWDKKKHKRKSPYNQRIFIDYKIAGDVLYLNIDSIEKFYREESITAFNFADYYNGDLGINTCITNPIKIITTSGNVYYSPNDLKDISALTEEEIDSRFEILDL